MTRIDAAGVAEPQGKEEGDHDGWVGARTREFGPDGDEVGGVSPLASAQRRPDIDGLRAVAIGLVCLFHFDLVPAMRGGFVGVDVFFVISGYLISSLTWRRLDEGRFRLADFYVRRARRLAPALVCVQILLLAAAATVLLPNEAVDIAKESIATQAYVANFYFWRSVNYFGLRAGDVPLLHCWSLAVEEHFYLIYPLFLVLVHRHARRHLAALLVLVAVMHLSDDEALTVFARQFRQTVQEVRRAVKRVYVWEPLPAAKMDVPSALARDLAFGRNTPIETTLAEHEATFGFLRQALQANTDLIDGVVSPTATMCQGGVCASRDRDGPLFFDNNHPAFSRADYFSGIIEAGLHGPNTPAR